MSCMGCSPNADHSSGQVIFLEGGMRKKPEWFKTRLPTGEGNERFQKVKQTLHDLKLVTVCEEAHCPNKLECWGGGTATFMLMGDTCTRGCRFCEVKHGKPQALDPEEPVHLASAIEKLDLDYVVITSVDRDDLPDGGASHFASCIREIKKRRPTLLVEVLTPDFRGKKEDIKTVLDANPDVFAHNIETVERLQSKIRDPRANYKQSLSVLAYVKEYAKEQNLKIFTKSSIMLGFGETEKELIQTMKDLRAIDVDFLTLGQYLRPTTLQLPVQEFVPPEKFDYFKRLAESLGFRYVASGPLVRSSYKAGELFISSLLGRTKIDF